MKKVFLFILLGFTLILLAYKFTSLDKIFDYSICDQAIRFRVDTVDPQFNLNRNNFLFDVKLAAQIWNNAWDKNLFLYDPQGDLSINLIYDERQSLTTQINQLENQVQSEQQSLKPQIAQFQTQAANFKQKVADLNREVEYWNSQGGAPPDEYQKIIAKQQDLRTEAEQLNAMAKTLNLSRDEYNLQVSQLNQTITVFNDALEQRPEEGVFKGLADRDTRFFIEKLPFLKQVFPSEEERIEVYFNVSKDELVHTLAHELGHALGLNHNSNSKSIMYYKTGQSTKLANEDLSSLNLACRKRSAIDLIQRYFDQFLFRFTPAS